jgi:hypothetical protein
VVQAGALSNYSYYVLSLATFSVVDGTFVALHLNRTVLNALKYQGIMLTQDASFLCTMGFLVADVYGNRMAAISCDTALRADSYIKDSTAPTLAQFDFSLNSTVGRFSLYFIEPVLISSFNITSLSLIGSNMRYLNISNAAIDIIETGSYAHIVQLSLSEDETDFLKLNDICRESNSCFAAIRPSLTADLSGNAVTAAQLPATNYIADSIRPVLVSLELDMNFGKFFASVLYNQLFNLLCYFSSLH